MRPGMRLGEALATCPELVLVEQDPATVEQAWEEILRRLEDAGSRSSRPSRERCYFETKGVERLYGGLEPALKRALAAVGPAWDAAGRRGRAALRGARGGERRAAGAGADRLRRPHAHVPRAAAADAAPARAGALRGARGARSTNDRTACRAAGWRRRRTTGAGRPARLEPGERRAGRQGSTPRTAAPCRLVETLEFPEAVGQELTLRRGLGVLIDRLLARPERAGRPPRKLALWARLVGGASWRRTVTLREPTADPARLRLALGAEARRAAGAGAQAAARGGRARRAARASSSSSSARRARCSRGRLREGLRQVKAAVGAGGVSMVVEVAPWSRIPEARALLVPRDD